MANYRKELTQRIGKCNKVLDGIKGSKWWKIITEDLGRHKQQIDDNWHLVNDEDKLKELKFTKYAVAHILNLEKLYSQDLKNAKEQLDKLDHPEKEVSKYYDNETKTEK